MQPRHSEGQYWQVGRVVVELCSVLVPPAKVHVHSSRKASCGVCLYSDGAM